MDSISGSGTQVEHGFVDSERTRGWAALDVRGHYKQAVPGVAWAAFQPLRTMGVFTFVFNNALGVESPDPTAPHAILSFTGLLPRQSFADALSRSGVGLVDNASPVTKVCFPRLVFAGSPMWSRP